MYLWASFISKILLSSLFCYHNRIWQLMSKLDGIVPNHDLCTSYCQFMSLKFSCKATLQVATLLPSYHFSISASPSLRQNVNSPCDESRREHSSTGKCTHLSVSHFRLPFLHVVVGSATVSLAINCGWARAYAQCPKGHILNKLVTIIYKLTRAHIDSTEIQYAPWSILQPCILSTEILYHTPDRISARQYDNVNITPIASGYWKYVALGPHYVALGPPDAARGPGGPRAT